MPTIPTATKRGRDLALAVTMYFQENIKPDEEQNRIIQIQDLMSNGANPGTFELAGGSITKSAIAIVLKQCETKKHTKGREVPKGREVLGMMLKQYLGDDIFSNENMKKILTQKDSSNDNNKSSNSQWFMDAACEYDKDKLLNNLKTYIKDGNLKTLEESDLISGKKYRAFHAINKVLDKCNKDTTLEVFTLMRDYACTKPENFKWIVGMLSHKSPAVQESFFKTLSPSQIKEFVPSEMELNLLRQHTKIPASFVTKCENGFTYQEKTEGFVDDLDKAVKLLKDYEGSWSFSRHNKPAVKKILKKVENKTIEDITVLMKELTLMKESIKLEGKLYGKIVWMEGEFSSAAKNPATKPSWTDGVAHVAEDSKLPPPNPNAPNKVEFPLASAPPPSSKEVEFPIIKREESPPPSAPPFDPTLSDTS